MFHYHVSSPCMTTSKIASTNQAPDLCQDSPLCQLNPSLFALTTGFNDKSSFGGVIGLARDGHLVYGPYNESGELWSCYEYDVCNGAFLEDDSYAYITKSEAPFSLNCWGPAETSSCRDFSCVGPFYEMFGGRSGDWVIRVFALIISICGIILIIISFYCFIHCLGCVTALALYQC